MLVGSGIAEIPAIEILNLDNDIRNKLVRNDCLISRHFALLISKHVAALQHIGQLSYGLLQLHQLDQSAIQYRSAFAPLIPMRLVLTDGLFYETSVMV